MTDVDRDKIEFDAETNTCETTAGIDDIENGQLLPSPSIIALTEEVRENENDVNIIKFCFIPLFFFATHHIICRIAAMNLS